MRWQSISEIVRAFVEKDRPGYALTALGLSLLTRVALAVIALLASAGAVGLLTHWLSTN